MVDFTDNKHAFCNVGKREPINLEILEQQWLDVECRKLLTKHLLEHDFICFYLYLLHYIFLPLRRNHKIQPFPL